jgi:phosphate transport system substrate-binding protein
LFKYGKRVTMLAGAASLVAGLTVPLVMSATPAFAGTTNYRINAVGSDTIYCVSSAVDKKYLGANKPTTGNQISNTPPVLNFSGLGCQPSPTPNSFVVPTDSVHGTITYNCVQGGAPDCIPGDGATGNLPPDGSSAGISALVADNGAGNIGYARSSRGRAGTDPANIDFWAFALDAVTWASYPATGGGSVNAPTNLTAAEIANIYNCTYTNWNQVPGNSAHSGTIDRYYPQPGSGTGKFFAQLFLGGVYPSNSGACPVTYVEENDGAGVVADENAASHDAGNAISPYSFAVWTAQGNAATGEQNIQGGSTLESVNGVAATLTHVSEPAAFANVTGDACTAPPKATQFCGSRYVYNVTDQVLGTNHAAYQAAILAQVGVAAPGGTPTTGFCANKYAGIIKLFGFKPLGVKTTAQSTSSDPVTGTSHCRQF